MADPYLSVVIPVFNEEENLPELLDRLTRTLVPLGKPYEVVLVNDGSRDRSLALLEEASARDPHLVVVDFNRNYGQHAAVFAGFEVCRGEVVVTLDADLQNPPEEIPKLVAKMEEGYDVVGSVRVHRQDPLLRRVASRIINRMTAVATGVQLTDYGCMLRAYRRPVVKVLASSREISTFIPVLADLFAGRVTEVPVAHDERHHGTSKYSFLKLVRLQFDLMTSFSVLPLRVTMGVGVVMAVISMVLGLGADRRPADLRSELGGQRRLHPLRPGLLLPRDPALRHRPPGRVRGADLSAGAPPAPLHRPPGDPRRRRSPRRGGDAE